MGDLLLLVEPDGGPDPKALTLLTLRPESRQRAARQDLGVCSEPRRLAQGTPQTRVAHALP